MLPLNCSYIETFKLSPEMNNYLSENAQLEEDSGNEGPGKSRKFVEGDTGCYYNQEVVKLGFGSVRLQCLETSLLDFSNISVLKGHLKVVLKM